MPCWYLTCCTRQGRCTSFGTSTGGGAQQPAGAFFGEFEPCTPDWMRRITCAAFGQGTQGTLLSSYSLLNNVHSKPPFRRALHEHRRPCAGCLPTRYTACTNARLTLLQAAIHLSALPAPTPQGSATAAATAPGFGAPLSRVPLPCGGQRVASAQPAAIPGGGAVPWRAGDR